MQWVQISEACMATTYRLQNTVSLLWMKTMHHRSGTTTDNEILAVAEAATRIGNITGRPIIPIAPTFFTYSDPVSLTANTFLFHEKSKNEQNSEIRRGVTLTS